MTVRKDTDDIKGTMFSDRKTTSVFNTVSKRVNIVKLHIDKKQKSVREIEESCKYYRAQYLKLCSLFTA